MEKRPKILLVDDDIDFVEIAKRALERDQYEVVAAYSGTEGKEAAEREMPDLIILDAMMESLTEGFHVAHELRSHPKLKSVPIIMLTAINVQGDYPWRLDKDEQWLPVDRFLDKPVEPDRLRAEVKAVLEGRKGS